MITTEERAPMGWRGVGRPIVVAVLGNEALAELVREPGIEVSLYETEATFCVSEPAFTAEVFDALVVDQEPWPDVDGVELARGLRRRCIGTVVVAAAGARYLLEECLAVLPRSATGAVTRGDLQAAVAVAAQETWALAPMCDPWREDDASEQTTADHCVEPEILAVHAAPPAVPAPSVTPSQVRLDAQGHASRSTMIQLFEEDLGGLEAPALSTEAVAESGPTWASGRTREWLPSGSLLVETLGGHDVESGRLAPSVAPVVRHPTVETAAFESDHPGRLPSAAGGLGSRLWFWSAVGLGLTAIGLLGVLLWVRG